MNIGILSKLSKLKSLKYLLLGYRLFKVKLGLFIGFIFFIIPDMMGTYSYLRYYDIHPIVAIPATVGVEFGGAFFELLNTFRQLPSAHTVEVVVLLVGVLWAIHRVFYGVAAFQWFNKMFGSQDNPQIFVLLIGAGFFALCVSLAVAVDMYILPANAQRVPGIVYTLNNLDSTVFPLADAARDHFMQEAVNQSSNATQSINKSVTNSTLG